MKYHTSFFRKLGKMSQNLSSAAVVIGALRVNKIRPLVSDSCSKSYIFVNVYPFKPNGVSPFLTFINWTSPFPF